MPVKMTTEQFVAKAKLVHGDKYAYTNTEYFGNDKQVSIVCKIHGVFEQRANDHLSKKAGCQSCAGVKKLTQAEFLRRAKSVHGDRYDYSKVVYKNFESKVIIICDKGHEFPQTPHSHLNGFNCPHCAGTAKSNTEEFVARGRERYGDKFDYSKVVYVNSTTPVTIVCPVKGEFQQAPIVHLTCATGYSAEIVNEPASHAEFVTKARLTHGDRYDYSNSVYIANKKPIEIICKDHGPFTMLVHNHYKGSGCPSCACADGASKPEAELVEALKDFTPEKTRSVLSKNRELDLYFKESKVAVEVNGIYWHSDVHDNSKFSHRDKQRDCQKLGIRLMQFTDAEIYSKKSIVVSMVENALGVSERVYARDCVVREVGFAEYTKFFNDNHISGSVASKAAFGLYFDNELVSCMSFNKPRFDKDTQWEIIRFATKLNITVVGGASKLFKAFTNAHTPESVLSYADLRFGTGGVYEKLGFVYSHTSDVGFSYHHKDGAVLSRYQAQRHRLPGLLGDKFDESKSARDNMVANGWHLLYDCGNNVYRWSKLS